MKILIPLYQKIKQKVMFLCDKMSLSMQGNHKGRRLAVNKIDSLNLAVFKQSEGIKTKKSIWKIFEPNCSYKTLVMSLNRVAKLSLRLLGLILIVNRHSSHPIKHTDSTDIPVCLNKNANKRVMSPFPPVRRRVAQPPCSGSYAPHVILSPKIKMFI
mgnify:CR=1 FL=1